MNLITIDLNGELIIPNYKKMSRKNEIDFKKLYAKESQNNMFVII